jgi:hypothetical protein
MAAGDLSTLNGLFKVVYADKILDLIPDFAILQKRIEFSPADKQTGNYYAQPVVLKNEHGVTYLGDTGAVAALNAAVGGQTAEAQVKGSEMVLRAQLSYTALSRAATQGARAFRRASAFKVEDMNNSARKRLELSMLYGQRGLGVVSSNTAGALVITDATWAPGVWAGLEGAILEAWSATTDSATQHNADLTISAVDMDAKTVTVTGTSAAVVANDILYFKGARTSTGFNEMAGVAKIIANSGTLFNISAASYSLWKGTTVSSVGQLTFAKIQDAAAKAVNKGLMGKLLCLVSPRAWGVLNSDMAALRVLDGSYSSRKGENGHEALEFHGVNGPIEILSHPFVREGDTFLIPERDVLRIGSQDLDFSVPGFNEQFFRLVDGYNAVELQCMCDQAVFIQKPAQAVLMTGITYT